MHTDLQLLSLVLIGLAIGSQAPAPSFAQENGRQSRQERAADGVVAERLKKFSDAYTAEKYDEVRRRGAELLRMRLSPFEIGNVERALADVDQREERWSDARDHLQRALASGGLDDRSADATRYQIVQLFGQEERWSDVVDAWNVWAAAALAPPGSSAYGDLAFAYFSLEDFERALEPARKAVELARQPSEQALRLLIAIQVRREAYAEAVPLLKGLLAVTPLERDGWVQLAGVDVQLGNEAEAAQSMQIAYYGGLLTGERDLLHLSQLLVQIGIPYRAARILSSTIESGALVPDAKLYQFLGETWIAAREYARAIEPLTRAAELSEDGDLYLRVAELHAQLEDWSSVVTALRLGLDKGHLDDRCRAALLLGIALYRQEEPTAARRWLERTLDCPGAPAKPWLRLLDGETANPTP